MKYYKRLILRAAAAALLACLFASGTLKLLGTGLTGAISGFDEDYYLKCFYDIYNKGTRAMPESDAIRVIDIGDYLSRSQMAELLGKVAECKPAIIGFDVFMAHNGELKDDADQKILEALSLIECPFVSPCIFDDNAQSLQYPFYKDFFARDNFIYASPLAFDMLGEYETVDPRSPVNTMAYSIVANYSRAKGLEEPRFEGMALNYRNKEFFSTCRLEDIDPKDLEGKIVLMGDCKDYRDIRTTPFKIMGSNNLPGIINIGYTVNSLLCSRDYCEDNGFSPARRRYNQPYKKFSIAVNLAISYIMCFFLSIIITLFSIRNVESFGKFKRTVFIILSFLSILAAEVIMVFLCFSVFTSLLMIIPDILLFLTSLLYVDTCIKIVEVFNNESSAYLDI